MFGHDRADGLFDASAGFQIAQSNGNNTGANQMREHSVGNGAPGRLLLNHSCSSPSVGLRPSDRSRNCRAQHFTVSSSKRFWLRQPSTNRYPQCNRWNQTKQCSSIWIGSGRRAPFVHCWFRPGWKHWLRIRPNCSGRSTPRCEPLGRRKASTTPRGQPSGGLCRESVWRPSRPGLQGMSKARLRRSPARGLDRPPAMTHDRAADTNMRPGRRSR